MKITIETTDSDDRAELKRMFSASEVYTALWEISQEIFRPARRHGYADPNISKFFDEKLVPEGEVIAREELVSAFEKKFYEILEANGVNLED